MSECFVSYRISQYHSWQSQALQQHVENGYTRKKTDTGESRTPKSAICHLHAPAASYETLFRAKVKETGGLIKKYHIVLVETAVSVKPEYLRELKALGKDRLLFETAKEFLDQVFGSENVISVALHLDEQTPHMHAIYVPIIFDRERNTRRLAAKELLETTAKQITLQKGFTAHLNRTFPGIGQVQSEELSKKAFLGSNLLPYAYDVEEFAQDILRTAEELTPVSQEDRVNELRKKYMNKRTFVKHAYVKKYLTIRDQVILELEKKAREYEEQIGELSSQIDMEYMEQKRLEKNIAQEKKEAGKLLSLSAGSAEKPAEQKEEPTLPPLS